MALNLTSRYQLWQDVIGYRGFEMYRMANKMATAFRCKECADVREVSDLDAARGITASMVYVDLAAHECPKTQVKALIDDLEASPAYAG